MAAAGAGGREQKGADSVCLAGPEFTRLPFHSGGDAGFLCALEAESSPGGPVSGEKLFWLPSPAAVCNLKPGFGADH